MQSSEKASSEWIVLADAETRVVLCKFQFIAALEKREHTIICAKYEFVMALGLAFHVFKTIYAFCLCSILFKIYRGFNVMCRPVE